MMIPGWRHEALVAVIAEWHRTTDRCSLCHGMQRGYPIAHGPFEEEGHTYFTIQHPVCKGCGGQGRIPHGRAS